METRLTADNFDREIRETLRYKHNFGHEDLERTKGIMSDVIAHVQDKMDTKRGMGAEHLDTAMKFLKKDHAGWNKLPEHQQRHIETALKEHFGIAEAE